MTTKAELQPGSCAIYAYLAMLQGSRQEREADWLSGQDDKWYGNIGLLMGQDPYELQYRAVLNTGMVGCVWPAKSTREGGCYDCCQS